MFWLHFLRQWVCSHWCRPAEVRTGWKLTRARPGCDRFWRPQAAPAFYRYKFENLSDRPYAFEILGDLPPVSFKNFVEHRDQFTNPRARPADSRAKGIRLIPDGWRRKLGLAIEAIVGSQADLAKLAARIVAGEPGSGRGARRLLVYTEPGERMLDPELRDRLWQAFELPVFVQNSEGSKANCWPPSAKPTRECISKPNGDLRSSRRRASCSHRCLLYATRCSGCAPGWRGKSCRVPAFAVKWFRVFCRGTRREPQAPVSQVPAVAGAGDFPLISSRMTAPGVLSVGATGHASAFEPA